MELLSCLLLCSSLIIQVQNDSTYKGVKFEHTLTWEQIKAKARSQKKYIFVDCYATWCGPCKMMDREVYPHFRSGIALNEEFISVKVQMDSTENDSDRIKKWYTTAKKMKRDYKIDGLPTYLFFSSEGKLVHKESGFMDVQSFIRLSELARDPQKPLYYRKYQDYKHNKKDYPTMGKLAAFTKNLIGDVTIANSMAKDYKENYLDKLELSKQYSKENIDFISMFWSLVHSKDSIFSLSYHHPEQFDSIRGIKGSAKAIVNSTIIREEIESRVLKNGKGTIRIPEWDQLESIISKKYTSLDARKLLLNYKVRYYRNIYKDWSLWAKYKDEMLKVYPPIPPYGFDVFTEINGHGGAWHAFLNCPDTIVLLKALEWVELAIKMEDGNKNVMPEYYDTKANLMYKLGRKEEALKLESKAINLSAEGDNSGFVETYNKMRRGEPTWPIE